MFWEGWFFGDTEKVNIVYVRDDLIARKHLCPIRNHKVYLKRKGQQSDLSWPDIPVLKKHLFIDGKDKGLVQLETSRAYYIDNHGKLAGKKEWSDEEIEKTLSKTAEEEEHAIATRKVQTLWGKTAGWLSVGVAVYTISLALIGLMKYYAEFRGG